MKIKKVQVMNESEKNTYSFLLFCGLTTVFTFALWWFQPNHIPHNFTGLKHSLDYLIFFILSFIVWFNIILEVFNWHIANHMVRPLPMEPEKGMSVAFLTAFVPKNESYQILERNLKAMVAVEYPHDTWLLDEGNDPVAKKICSKYGVKHFSRKGKEEYNREMGRFKSKTKGGNYNSWFDQYGINYHIVAQVDVDFVPHKDFLTETLGYFRDPDVAFVGSPQIYANHDQSWIVRGAAEQAFSFFGPTQMGLDHYNMSLFIGSNHVMRTIAHHDIDGYAGHIVEDHLTGMHIYKKKWKSVYVPKILATGEGPATWEHYFNQQMRWAFGLFHILFNHSPKIYPRLFFRHLLNYFILQQYYFYGLAQGLAILLLFFYFVYGVAASEMNLIALIAFNIPVLIMQSVIGIWLQRFYINPKNEKGMHLKGKLLNIAVWPVYLLALFTVAVGKKITYQVTPKGMLQSEPTQFSLFIPHLILGLLSLLGVVISFFTKHQAPHLIYFAFLHTVFMLGFFFSVVLERLFHKLKKSISQKKIYVFQPLR